MGKVPGPVMTTEEACERRAGRICRRTGIARTAQKQVCDAAQGAAAPAHAIEMGGAPELALTTEMGCSLTALVGNCSFQVAGTALVHETPAVGMGCAPRTALPTEITEN